MVSTALITPTAIARRLLNPREFELFLEEAVALVADLVLGTGGLDVVVMFMLLSRASNLNLVSLKYPKNDMYKLALEHRRSRIRRSQELRYEVYVPRSPFQSTTQPHYRQWYLAQNPRRLNCGLAYQPEGVPLRRSQCRSSLHKAILEPRRRKIQLLRCEKTSNKISCTWLNAHFSVIVA